MKMNIGDSYHDLAKQNSAMVFSVVTHGVEDTYDEILCFPKMLKVMMLGRMEMVGDDDVDVDVDIEEVDDDDDDDNVRCSHSLLRHPVVHCQNNPKTRQLFLQQNSQEHTLLM